MRYSFFAVCALAALLCAPAAAFEKIDLTIRDVMTRSALLFAAEGTKAAILVHQSGKDAASWGRFAEQLQTSGIETLALESVATEDIDAGIDFLTAKGKSQFVLVGASIGGGAAQNVFGKRDADGITHLILLGTVRGDTARAVGVKKLFIVTENDFFSQQTHTSFQKASEPKKLVIFPGNAHAQDMFEQDYGDDLTATIREFIQN
ncbi:hypothetical protein [Lentilitoribacter sp. Alg239-R112]|uniref:alpha/beta hydrolase n=1 Tax=Lentilitoribacter sp. Alg239-R112 TaxID=2305987 RepID=UPI0013A7095A|nr:hypothetical protein [Lentilitoribacter sp. Alg239-R112]